ncbi:MAG: cytochrome [Burkholderia sp.]|jgi:cytochrome c553|nr:cytochrome [Burkholderia sp.]
MFAMRFCLGPLAALIVVANACQAQTPVANVHANSGPATAACVACHGAFGAGSATGIPRLAGQNPEYVAHALSMFKDRSRASDVMQGVAENLSESDMRELAEYFARQRPPRAEGAQSLDQDRVAAGKQLAILGAGTEVPACFNCHGAGGKGTGARFPSIAGQPETYLIIRLHEFQTRAKQMTAAPGSMTAVSAALNDTQIEQAAAYLSTLEP